MAMAASDIERLIRARIPDAEVTIQDLAGDGDHNKATVIAEAFCGKSRVQQHQIVYEALKAEMGGRLPRLGAADRHAGALRLPDPNGCAVLPAASFLESHSPISPFGGVKVGEARAI